MHFRKNLFFLSLLLGLLSTNLFAQSTTSTFKIRIASLSQSFDPAQFDNLKDLGVLMLEPADNGFTRVYLGTYMDRSTARRVQTTIKTRGYDQCYLVQDDYLFEGSEGEPLTHTLQFSAVKKLDVRMLIANLNSTEIGQAITQDLYIAYADGFYRLSMGLLAPENIDRINYYKTVMQNLGFSQEFLRQFRPTPTNYTAPAPKTQKETNPPNNNMINNSLRNPPEPEVPDTVIFRLPSKNSKTDKIKGKKPKNSQGGMDDPFFNKK